MLTRLQLEGANRPRCLNVIIDRLREVDGINMVDSSIAVGWIAIDNDELTERIIAWLGLTSQRHHGLKRNRDHRRPPGCRSSSCEHR